MFIIEFILGVFFMGLQILCAIISILISLIIFLLPFAALLVITILLARLISMPRRAGIPGKRNNDLDTKG